ncbi:MAG: CARDB domain-containing protein [Planctomycetaceae bacterium]
MLGRNSSISILAIGAALLVAITYAQESARRSSAYRVESREPALLPASEGPTLLPPQPIGGGSIYGSSADENAAITPEAEMETVQAPARIAPPAHTTRRAMDSARAGTVRDQSVTPVSDTVEAGAPGVRSVLKKTKPAQVQPAQPPTLTPPMEGPALQPAGEIVAPEGMELAPAEGAPANSSRRRQLTERGHRGAVKEEGDAPALHDLQLVSQNPQLAVEVNGPQSITVGKPAKYLVHLTNIGEQSANDVMIRLTLPTWVTARIADASEGEAKIQPDAQGTPRLVWMVPNCGTKGHHVLRFELIAAEGQPFDLAAEWTCRPTTTHGQVTVLQPQLDVVLSGPAEMNFGEEKVFTLTVSNPGNGDAANVQVTMSAGNAGAKQVEVGSISAGKKKEIPIQVAANEAGEMLLKAVATGDGGLQSEASARLKVRRPQLAVVVEGNEMLYAGAEIDYAIVVTNQGDAVAEDIQVTATLPAGAKYVGGIEGATASGNILKWKVASLAAAAEKVYDARLVLNSEGSNRVAVEVASANGSIASGEVVTEVQAVSDLKLVVNDPSGPNPTNAEAIYEVTVMNRGTRAAHDVRIVLQFSEGIEPVALEGGEGKIVPGQVVCEPLPELAPGEQVNLQVRAKAEKAGTMVYRVEVTQAEDEDRLVEEGTTKFFADNGRGGAGSRTAKRPQAPAGDGKVQR